MGYNIRSNEDPREGNEGKRPEIVAGRAPASNVHISTAYVAALAATSRVETESSLAKTSEQRARSAVEQGHYQPSSIVSRRSVEERAEHYGPKVKPHGGSSRISTSKKAGTALSSAANVLAGKLETETARSDDAGSQEVSGIISAGITGHTVFTAAQNVSPAIVRTGKNTWDVATAAGAATVSLIHTTRYMKSEFIPFDSPFAPQIFKNTFKELAAQTGLSSTATSRNIVYGITQLKTAQASLKDTAHTVRDGVKWTSTASRGEVLNAAKEKAKEAGKAAGEAALHVGKSGAGWTVKRGIPTAARGFEKGSMLAAQTLSESEDRMVSGIGGSLQLADAGVRTAALTGRTIRTGAKGVHTTAKAAKRVYNGLDYVYFASHGGLRAAWAAARQKAGAALAKAGSSAVSLVVNLLRSVGSKVLVPVVLIAACAMGVLSIVSAPTAVIGTVFSGHFSMELGDEQYTETEIRTFITDSNNGVGALANAYIDDIYADLQNALKANGGNYDIVRFKASSRAEDEYLEVTREMVQEVFYTEVELADIIQPIFNAILLKDYSLEATGGEAQAVLEELFYKLFRITEVESLEWCGQSLADGSGVPDPEHTVLCHYIHAREDCPNKDEDLHSSPTCLNCDRSLCEGHEYIDPESGAVEIIYCGFPAWCEWMCTGYCYCGGHSVRTVTLSMDGTYELLYEYFEKPIEELSSIQNRTEAQDSQLEMLKVTYEACYEFIRITMLDFAGGMSLNSLEDIQFVKGTRAGYPAVIDLALSQVGQRGGQPFWHSYGFSHRVEWCACFVEWCMRRTPSAASEYPTIAQTGNNASSSAVARYFQQTGAWANGGYTDLAAGDLIFIDWDCDGQIDHIGMVIGQDGTHVYTVEGNRGDKVITDVYDLNASVIFGYGLMGATAS